MITAKHGYSFIIFALFILCVFLQFPIYGLEVNFQGVFYNTDASLILFCMALTPLLILEEVNWRSFSLYLLGALFISSSDILSMILVSSFFILYEKNKYNSLVKSLTLLSLVTHLFLPSYIVASQLVSLSLITSLMFFGNGRFSFLVAFIHVLLISISEKTLVSEYLVFYSLVFFVVLFFIKKNQMESIKKGFIALTLLYFFLIQTAETTLIMPFLLFLSFINLSSDGDRFKVNISSVLLFILSIILLSILKQIDIETLIPSALIFLLTSRVIIDLINGKNLKKEYHYTLILILLFSLFEIKTKGIM